MNEDLLNAISNTSNSDQQEYEEIINKFVEIEETYLVTADEITAAIKRKERENDAIRELETFKGDEAKIFTGEQKYLMIKALKQYQGCAGDFLSYGEYVDLSNQVREIINLLDVEGEMK